MHSTVNSEHWTVKNLHVRCDRDSEETALSAAWAWANWKRFLCPHSPPGRRQHRRQRRKTNQGRTYRRRGTRAGEQGALPVKPSQTLKLQTRQSSLHSGAENTTEHYVSNTQWEAAYQLHTPKQTPHDRGLEAT